MKNCSKHFLSGICSLLSFSLIAAGCSQDFTVQEKDSLTDTGLYSLRSALSVTDSLTVNTDIAKPFGLVADTSADNLIR